MANYFQSPLGVNHIPDFITARTPQGLRRAILRNNAKHKAFINYENIQWVESEKRWYAWFYAPIEGTTQQIKNLNGDLDGNR